VRKALAGNIKKASKLSRVEDSCSLGLRSMGVKEKLSMLNAACVRKSVGGAIDYGTKGREDSRNLAVKELVLQQQIVLWGRTVS